MTKLASVEDLESFLGRRVTEDQRDRAELVLTLASGVIQSETRQQLVLVEDDEVTLTIRQGMRLPQRPVTAVASAAVDGRAIVGYGWNRQGQIWMPDSSWVVNLADTFSLVGHTATIVYSHGFETIPDDIRAVCLEVAARAYGQTDATGIPQDGPGQTLMLLPWERQTLARYRVPAGSVETPARRSAWTSF